MDLPLDLFKDVAFGVRDFEEERHGAYGVGGTGETGVVTTDGTFHTVQGALLHIGAVHVGFGRFQNSLVHGRVILSRGDQQIDAGEDPVGVHLVVVEEGSPGSF